MLSLTTVKNGFRDGILSAESILKTLTNRFGSIAELNRAQSMD